MTVPLPKLTASAPDLHEVGAADDAPPPAADPTKHHWEPVERAVRMPANVGVLFVAIMAYIQYQDATLDSKRQRSLDMVSEWNTRSFPESFARLSAFIDERRIAGETYPQTCRPTLSSKLARTLG